MLTITIVIARMDQMNQIHQHVLCMQILDSNVKVLMLNLDIRFCTPPELRTVYVIVVTEVMSRVADVRIDVMKLFLPLLPKEAVVIVQSEGN